MQVTDMQCALIVLGLLGIAMLCSMLFEYTRPRITHLLSVDWYGYAITDPTYCATVEIQRRRLFRSPLISHESMIVLSPRFCALRDVRTSEKIPEWLSDQIIRQVQNKDIRKLHQQEVIRRITDARMSLDQDPALHP